MTIAFLSTMLAAERHCIIQEFRLFCLPAWIKHGVSASLECAASVQERDSWHASQLPSAVPSSWLRFAELKFIVLLAQI